MHASRSESSLGKSGAGVRLAPFTPPRGASRQEESKQQVWSAATPTNKTVRLVDATGRPLDAPFQVSPQSPAATWAQAAHAQPPPMALTSPVRGGHVDADGLPVLSLLSPQGLRQSDGDMSSILISKVKKTGTGTLNLLAAAKNSPLVEQHRETKRAKAHAEERRQADLQRSGMARRAAYQPVGGGGRPAIVSDARSSEVEAPSFGSPQKLRVTDFTTDGGMGARFGQTTMEAPTLDAENATSGIAAAIRLGTTTVTQHGAPLHLQHLAAGVAEKGAAMRAQLRGLDLLSTAFSQLIDEVAGSKGNLARLLRRVRDNYRNLFGHLVDTMVNLNNEYHGALAGCVADYKQLQLKMDGKVAHLEQRVRLLTSVSASKDNMIQLSGDNVRTLESELKSLKDDVILGVKGATLQVENASNALLKESESTHKTASQLYGSGATGPPGTAANGEEGSGEQSSSSGFGSGVSSVEALTALSTESRNLQIELTELLSNVELHSRKSEAALGALDNLLDRGGSGPPGAPTQVDALAHEAAFNVAMAAAGTGPNFLASSGHTSQRSGGDTLSMSISVEPMSAGSQTSPNLNPASSPRELSELAPLRTNRSPRPSVMLSQSPLTQGGASSSSPSLSPTLHPFLSGAGRPPSGELRKSSRWQWLRAMTEDTRLESRWTSSTQTEEEATAYCSLLHVEGVDQSTLWQRALLQSEHPLRGGAIDMPELDRDAADETAALKRQLQQAADREKQIKAELAIALATIAASTAAAAAVAANKTPATAEAASGESDADSAAATAAAAASAAAAAAAAVAPPTSALPDAPPSPRRIPLRPFPLRVNGFILPGALREFLTPLFSRLEATGVLGDDCWGERINERGHILSAAEEKERGHSLRSSPTVTAFNAAPQQRSNRRSLSFSVAQSPISPTNLSITPVPMHHRTSTTATGPTQRAQAAQLSRAPSNSGSPSHSPRARSADKSATGSTFVMPAALNIADGSRPGTSAGESKRDAGSVTHSRRGSVNMGSLPLASMLSQLSATPAPTTLIAHDREAEAKQAALAAATPPPVAQPRAEPQPTVSEDVFEPLGPMRRASLRLSRSRSNSIALSINAALTRENTPPRAPFKEPQSVAELNPGAQADDSRFAIARQDAQAEAEQQAQARNAAPRELVLPAARWAQTLPPLSVRETHDIIFAVYASYCQTYAFRPSAASAQALQLAVGGPVIPLPTSLSASATPPAHPFPVAAASSTAVPLPTPPSNGLVELVIEYTLQRSGSASKAPVLLGSFVSALLVLYARSEFVRQFCHFLGLVSANAASGLDAADFLSLECLDMYARAATYLHSSRTLAADPATHAFMDYSGDAATAPMGSELQDHWPPLSYLSARTAEVLSSELLAQSNVKLPSAYEMAHKLSQWMASHLRTPNSKLPPSRQVAHLPLPAFLLRVAREWRVHVRSVIFAAAKKATPPMSFQSDCDIDLDQWTSFLRAINAPAADLLLAAKPAICSTMLRQFVSYNRRNTGGNLDYVCAGLVPMLRQVGMLTVGVEHLLVVSSAAATGSASSSKTAKA